MTGRRVVRVLGACALMTAGIGAAAFVTAPAADAAICSGPVPSGVSCTITGTLTMTSGPMTLTSPTALGWAATANGLDQQVVDTTIADQSFQINDSTGTAPGWHITVSATTFTTGAPVHTLANAGTFAANGSLFSITTTTAPGAACATGSTCTLPTDTTTYPVAVTTAATAPTAVNLYDASALTGLGTINVGASSGGAPVGWWLNLPSNTIAGTYTSTVTLEMISGP
jgi:WxL domain surface cell wall-binding